VPFAPWPPKAQDEEEFDAVPWLRVPLPAPGQPESLALRLERDADGTLRVVASDTRSQKQNRELAEERLAAFLLNLSQRFTARGYSPTEFHLRMTREEIGSYLGLKLETVSRAFSRFQDDGLISVQQKHIRIMDILRIKALLAPPDGRIG